MLGQLGSARGMTGTSLALAPLLQPATIAPNETQLVTDPDGQRLVDDTGQTITADNPA